MIHRSGRELGRQARVHLVQSHTGYEAVVDVANRIVLEFREVTDRQYMRGASTSPALLSPRTLLTPAPLSR